MIPGIPSSGGYFPPSFVNKVRPSTVPSTPSPAPEVAAEPQPSDLRAPEGDEASLTREYNLFDLASRQYSQILPRLELATTPVD